jgi:hypothetical protein
MAVLITRKRTLGVRMSSEEYSSIESFCVETRARSMSDFARNAILGYMKHVREGGGPYPEVNQNTTLPQELDQELTRIAAELTRLKARLQTQERNRTQAKRRQTGRD